MLKTVFLIDHIEFYSCRFIFSKKQYPESVLLDQIEKLYMKFKLLPKLWDEISEM